MKIETVNNGDGRFRVIVVNGEINFFHYYDVGTIGIFDSLEKAQLHALKMVADAEKAYRGYAK